MNNVKLKVFNLLAMMSLVVAGADVVAESEHSLNQVDQNVLLQQSRKQVKTLGAALKLTLISAMTEKVESTEKNTKSAGTSSKLVSAIKACNLKALAIAQAQSQNGWQVGRTSLKVRNTNNAPDDWELSVLQAFEARKAKGEPLTTMESSLLTASEFRYMKPISTGGVCLSCHGEEISSEVRQILDKLYPEDQATGFKLGNIRGAFTVRKAIN